MNLVTPTHVRRIILEQSHRAHVGHIGSALSIADIVAALYNGVLRINSPEDQDRDRFILSKGHAALALYAALALRGFIPKTDLNSFCGDNSLLGVHPEYVVPGIDFSTGSLGQGLSMGAGAALAARIQKSGRKVYVLMSDAEVNEGSVWEAAMFAAHHRLRNLCAIIDLNGQQALGYTKDVMSLPNMQDRWKSFGWETHEVDGHDAEAIKAKIASFNTDSPHMLIAKTTFGKGVSFMENQIKWHYWPMSDAEYAQAIAEVGA